MKKIIKLSLFLGIVSCIAAFALMMANNITAPIIKENQDKQTNISLKKLYAEASSFKEVVVNEGSVKAYYEVIKDNDIIGYIYQLRTTGFQSEIDFLIAFDLKGDYQGIEIVSQAETSGYGSQITLEAYQEQFKEKNIDDEVDLIAGSTITTTAVAKAIDEATTHYKTIK